MHVLVDRRALTECSDLSPPICFGNSAGCQGSHDGNVPVMAARRRVKRPDIGREHCPSLHPRTVWACVCGVGDGREVVSDVFLQRGKSPSVQGLLFHGAATVLTLCQAIALLAAAVLLLSHFAPEGSRLVETGGADEDGEAAPNDGPALDGPDRAGNGTT